MDYWTELVKIDHEETLFKQSGNYISESDDYDEYSDY
jgi:hypothetical protein